MTKNEIVDLIWEWATEELEINKEKGLITCSKEQKERFNPYSPGFSIYLIKDKVKGAK